MKKFNFYIKGKVKAKDKVSVLIKLDEFIKYSSIEDFDFEVEDGKN